MKKSLIMASIIVAASIIWIGSCWFTGKLIEHQMIRVINNANYQLHNLLLNTSVKLHYELIKRGIFNSKIRLILCNDTQTNTNNTALKPSDEITFLVIVEHGPFPFSQLIKFNLLPNIALADIQLERTTATKNLFNFTKGKQPFHGISRISYNDNVSSDITIPPIEYPIGNSSLKMNCDTIHINMSRNMAKIMIHTNNTTAVVSSLNRFHETKQIILHGILLKQNSHASQFNVDLIDHTIIIKDLKLVESDQQIIELDGLSLESKLIEKDNNISGQIAYTLDALKMQDYDFGAAKLRLNINNIASNSLKKITHDYKQRALALFQYGRSFSLATNHRQTSNIFLRYFPLLLQNNPTINIAPISWKNSQGESLCTINLLLTTPSQAGSLYQLIIHSIKRLDATLTIPLKMATKITEQAAQLQGYNAEDARKLAKQQVESLTTISQMFKLIIQHNNVISSNLHYIDNQFTLNGSKLSLQEFLYMLGIPTLIDKNQIPQDTLRKTGP